MTAKTRCSFFVPVIVLVTVLIVSAASLASTYRTGETVRLTNLHRIDDDLYIMADDITVDGYVDGDLCAGGSSIYTNGEITQTLNAFANKVHHTGLIGGSIRAFAYSLTIDGQVGRSVMGFTYDMHVGRGAMIERDVNMFGYSTRIDGQVNRDVKVKGERVVIAGRIGGNVDLEAKYISVIPPAMIAGDLTYTGAEEVTIDSAGGVIIAGAVKQIIPDEGGEGAEEATEEAGLTVKDVVFPLAKILAAFLFGVIVVALFRRYAEVSFKEMRGRLPVSFAAGSLLLLIVFVAVIVFIVALVGLVVGLILISGETAVFGAAILVLSFLSMPITAFASVSGGVMFYAGKIVVAFMIGYLLARIFKREPKLLGTWQMLVGLVILTLFFSIPYVGIILYLLVSITGAGAILMGIRKCRPHGGQPAPQDTAVTTRPQGGPL